jgi:hypothetical protein
VPDPLVPPDGAGQDARNSAAAHGREPSSRVRWDRRFTQTVIAGEAVRANASQTSFRRPRAQETLRVYVRSGPSVGAAQPKSCRWPRRSWRYQFVAAAPRPQRPTAGWMRSVPPDVAAQAKITTGCATAAGRARAACAGAAAAAAAPTSAASATRNDGPGGRTRRS